MNLISGIAVLIFAGLAGIAVISLGILIFGQVIDAFRAFDIIIGIGMGAIALLFILGGIALVGFGIIGFFWVQNVEFVMEYLI